MTPFHNLARSVRAPGSFGQAGGHLGSAVSSAGFHGSRGAQYKTGVGWGATGGAGSNMAPPAWAPPAWAGFNFMGAALGSTPSGFARRGFVPGGYSTGGGGGGTTGGGGIGTGGGGSSWGGLGGFGSFGGGGFLSGLGSSRDSIYASAAYQPGGPVRYSGSPISTSGPMTLSYKTDPAYW